MRLKKRKLHSPEKQKKTRDNLRIRFALSASILVVLLVVLALFSRLPELEVKEVRSEGNALIPEDELVSYARTHLDTTYFGILTASNIFFYPKKTTADELTRTFPQLRKVSVLRNGLQEIIVHAFEYRPHSLWCGEERDPSAPCYFVSEDGVIFARAPHFSEGVFLKMYGPVTGEAVRQETYYKKPLGFTIFATPDFTQLAALLSVFDAMKFNATTLVYEENGNARLILANGPHVKFNLTQNFERLVRDMDAAFSSGEVTAEDIIKRTSTIEYIDMRFDGRVFFK